ncbi:MAG: hypothetical protein ACPG61_07065 [Paracoccaceae bacterium]
MAKVVGDVAIKVGADTTSLVTGMRSGEASLAKFAKVGGAAMLAVGAAMAALTKKSLANIDVLAKQARSLGLTTAAFQKMTLVASEAGVETGKLASSLGIMQRNIEELRKGTKTQTDAFKALGLSLSDLDGQSPDEQFEKLADALDKVEDPSRRTALAMDTLGRGGRDMINMLGGYGEKAREAAEFQERFGIAVRQAASEDVERANDAVGRLGMVMEGLGNKMATAVAPAIEGVANALVTFVGNVTAAKVTLEEFFGTLENARATLGEDIFNRLVGNPAAILDLQEPLQRVSQELLFLGNQIQWTTPKLEEFAAALDEAGQIGAAEVMRSYADELKDVSRQYEEGTITGEAFKAKVKEIEDRARDLVIEFGNIDLAKFTAVTGELDKLRAVLNLAGDAAAYLKSVMMPQVGRGGDPRQMGGGFADWTRYSATGGATDNAPTGSPRPQLPSVDADFGSPIVSGGGGGGGSGGGADPRTARIEQLIQGLKTEREIIDAWYAESLELLSSATEAELAALGGKHEAIERLEEEHQERLGRIREMGNQWGAQAALEGGAAILGAMASTNKKAAKMQGIFAASAALMSTLQGAAKELEKGTFGFITAAAVMAKGLGFVAAIKSASSAASSGGAVASGAGGGATAAPAAPEPRRVAEFRFMGGNVLDPRAIVDAVNDAYDQGYQIRAVLG